MPSGWQLLRQHRAWTDPTAKAQLLVSADADWARTKELHARADRVIHAKLSAAAGGA